MYQTQAGKGEGAAGQKGSFQHFLCSFGIPCPDKLHQAVTDFLQSLCRKPVREKTAISGNISLQGVNECIHPCCRSQSSWNAAEQVRIQHHHFRNQEGRGYCHLHLPLVVADHRKRSHFTAGPRCGRHCHQGHLQRGNLPGFGSFIILKTASVTNQNRSSFGGIHHRSASHSNQTITGILFIHGPDLLHCLNGRIGFRFMEHRIPDSCFFQAFQHWRNDSRPEQMGSRDNQGMFHDPLNQASGFLHGPRSRHHGFRHMPGKCLDISVSAHSMNPLIFRAARISCTLPSMPMRALLIVKS